MSAGAVCPLGKKPANSSGYLENMAGAIFRMGFSRRVVEMKWPAIKKNFANFSARQVARFGSADVNRMMKDSGMIRNSQKIHAVIQNARTMEEIRKEFTSFPRYLEKNMTEGGEDKLFKDLNQRFCRLGPKTALVFLRTSGYDVWKSV